MHHDRKRGPSPLVPTAPRDAAATGAAAWKGSDRRIGDRRTRPTRPWLDLFSPSRRARGRRASDLGGYVDRYTKRDVALLLAIFLLNVADAFMTMLWLHRGGREANPIMDFFLDIGPAAFLFQKCLVVGFWLILLLVHKNFRFAKIGLYASLAVYSVLLIVHFAIVALGIEPPPREGNEPTGLQPPAGPASVEETAHEHRHDRLDPQDARPEMHRLEADRGEPLDLVVEQPALRSDEERDRSRDAVGAGRGRRRMGEQAAAAREALG